MSKLKRFKHIITLIAYSYGNKKPEVGDIVRHIEKSIDSMDVNANVLLNKLDKTYKGEK